MFSCYDQCPMDQIVNYLMVTNIEDIDLLSVVTVLAKRLSILESRNSKELEVIVNSNRKCPMCKGSGEASSVLDVKEYYK